MYQSITGPRRLRVELASGSRFIANSNHDRLLENIPCCGHRPPTSADLPSSCTHLGRLISVHILIKFGNTAFNKPTSRHATALTRHRRSTLHCPYRPFSTSHLTSQSLHHCFQQRSSCRLDAQLYSITMWSSLSVTIRVGECSGRSKALERVHFPRALSPHDDLG